MQPVVADVVIVGGGISGLAAACALRKAGASVVVLEKRTEAGDPHRGDVLRPWAVSLFASWGASLENHGALPLRELVVEAEGRVVVRRVPKDDAVPMALPHPQIETALRDAAKAMGVDVRLGWHLQLLMQDASGWVRGLTAVSSSDGAEFRAKLVVGADGRSSAVREKLGIRMAAKGGAHGLLAIEADVPQSSGPQGPRVAYRVGADGGALIVPLAGGRRVRISLVMEPEAAEAVARGSPAEICERLVARNLLPPSARIDPMRVRAYTRGGTEHALNYAANGAVCIGDAVHIAPMPSSEGIHMSLLDATGLAKHLGHALSQGDKAIARALDRFERERWPDNEARLGRERKAHSWLVPLTKGRCAYAKSPLGRFSLGRLLPVK